MAATPADAGHCSRFASTSVPARPHGRAGATAIMNSSRNPIGMVMRSK